MDFGEGAKNDFWFWLSKVVFYYKIQWKEEKIEVKGNISRWRPSQHCWFLTLFGFFFGRDETKSGTHLSASLSTLLIIDWSVRNMFLWLLILFSHVMPVLGMQFLFGYFLFSLYRITPCPLPIFPVFPL